MKILNLKMRILPYGQLMLTMLFIQSNFLFSMCPIDSLKNKQKDTDTVQIVIDASNNTVNFNGPKVVKQDGSIALKIENINLFLYDVAIVEQQNAAINNTVLNEVPRNFVLSLKTLDKSKLKVKEIGITVIAESSDNIQLITLNDSIKKINYLIDKVEYEKNTLISAIATMTKDTAIDISTVAKQKINLNVINQDIEDYKLQLLKTETAFNKEMGTNATRNDKITLFNNRFEEYKKSLEGLYNAITFYNELLIIAQSSTFDANEAIDIKKRIAYNYYNSDDQVIIMFKLNTILKTISSNFNNVMAVFNSFTPDDLKVINMGSSIEGFKSFNDDLHSDIYTDLMTNIIVLYNSIDNENYECMHSTNIIKDDADLVSFQIKITPKAGLNHPVSPKPSINTFEVRISHGTKIDFSAGLFNNFLLNDNNYSIMAVGSDSSKIVLNSKQDVFLPSVGGLINVYRRGPKDLKLAFSTGISVTQNQSVAYYLGGSLMFGRSQRIIGTLGVAGKQVQTATDNYKAGTFFSETPSDVGVIEYLNPAPFKVGMFLGLTFNLTNGLGNENVTKFLTNQSY